MRLTDEEYQALKGKVRGGVVVQALKVNALAACLMAAPSKDLRGTPDLSNRQPVPNPAPSPLSYRLTLKGQLSGGKNNVGVTRTGKRFPNKSFVRWRDSAMQQVWTYLGGRMGMPPYLYAKPHRVELSVNYYPGNLLRRDAPALIDALCHLLERTGLVEDDAQIKMVHWQEMELDRKNPRVELTLRPAEGAG